MIFQRLSAPSNFQLPGFDCQEKTLINRFCSFEQWSSKSRIFLFIILPFEWRSPTVAKTFPFLVFVSRAVWRACPAIMTSSTLLFASAVSQLSTSQCSDVVARRHSAQCDCSQEELGLRGNHPPNDAGQWNLPSRPKNVL